MTAKYVSDATFETEVLSSKVPVLVDFWAPWCGPCRAMGGLVDELAADVDGRAKVVKVNIDEASDTAVKYGVSSIPTFAVFENGELKTSLAGAVPKAKLVELLA